MLIINENVAGNEPCNEIKAPISRPSEESGTMMGLSRTDSNDDECSPGDKSDQAQSLSQKNAASGSNLGRRGDPRMHKAVAARIADPSMSLLEALTQGGFHFVDFCERSGKSDRDIYDVDGVQLCQRKNQLSRRLRLLRKRGDAKAASVAAKNTGVTAPSNAVPANENNGSVFGAFAGDLLASQAMGINMKQQTTQLMNLMLLQQQQQQQHGHGHGHGNGNEYTNHNYSNYCDGQSLSSSLSDSKASSSITTATANDYRDLHPSSQSHSNSHSNAYTNTQVFSITNPNCPPLYDLLSSHEWEGALEEMHKSPEYASFWILDAHMEYPSLPLHFICTIIGHAPFEIVKALLEAYADGACRKDGTGSYPLHIACEHIHIGNCTTSTRYTRSSSVTASKSCEASHYLSTASSSSSSSSIICKSKSTRSSALASTLASASASGSSRKTSLDSIMAILESYPDATSQKDETGRLPLHVACANNAPLSIVKALIDAFPDGCTMKDYNGHTALTYVNGQGNGNNNNNNNTSMNSQNDGEGRGDGEDRGDRDFDHYREDHHYMDGEREDIVSLFEPYEDGRIRRRNDDDLDLSCGDGDEMNEI
mmetsp:Transcript_8093/g.12066  ORF Transcript_8093/g.12066 Transcript_8093/m.12066 type:complete len:595 (+) Transcript_8093:178-1962(+)